MLNCLSFPTMFKGSTTLIKYDTNDHEATRQCLKTFLACEAREMFGDPDFGIKLKAFFYDQNNDILKDILIDEIYTKISTFNQQVFLERKNVEIKQINSTLYLYITYKIKDDFVTDTLNLVLFNNEEE